MRGPLFGTVNVCRTGADPALRWPANQATVGTGLISTCRA
jgi:hypothetical protein